MPSNAFFPMDAGDHARIVIDSTHHEVHEGALYEFHYENLAPASGLTTYIHIKTGLIKLHAYLQFEAVGGLLKINMYDGATVGTAGTAINCFNLNRTITDSITTKVYVGSTVGTTGTAFATKTILATSTSQSKANSSVKEFAERNWAPSKDYIIAIVTGAASMSFTVDGVIGEHP